MVREWRPAGARAVEILAGASFDDDDVDPRQRQLARQHQPGRAASCDHHRVLGHRRSWPSRVRRLASGLRSKSRSARSRAVAATPASGPRLDVVESPTGRRSTSPDGSKGAGHPRRVAPDRPSGADVGRAAAPDRRRVAASDTELMRRAIELADAVRATDVAEPVGRAPCS